MARPTAYLTTYEWKNKGDWLKFKDCALDRETAQSMVESAQQQSEIRREKITPLYRKQANTA